MSMVLLVQLLMNTWHYSEGKCEMHSNAAGPTGSRADTTGEVAPSLKCIRTHSGSVRVFTPANGLLAASIYDYY